MTARVSAQPVQLSPAELSALAHTLGDSPETAIPVHRLMRAACSAYVVGEPTRFDAAVIVSHDNPGEPDGFGEDPEALWSILGPLEGWRVVDVSASVAPKLGRRSALRPAAGSPTTATSITHSLTPPSSTPIRTFDGSRGTTAHCSTASPTISSPAYEVTQSLCSARGSSPER